MATVTVQLSEGLKALAEARAADARIASIEEYVAHLIREDAAGAPPGRSTESDEQLEALLATRADGPLVDMDAADFKRIREKFMARHRRGTGSHP